MGEDVSVSLPVPEDVDLLAFAELVREAVPGVELAFTAKWVEVGVQVRGLGVPGGGDSLTGWKPPASLRWKPPDKEHPMGTNYYVRTEGCQPSCVHCPGPETIHLGKDSAGWAFTFRAYPETAQGSGRSEIGRGRVVTDFASWAKLLDLGKIEDESGVPTTQDELFALINRKRGGQNELGGHDYLDPDGNRFIPGYFC